MNVARIIDGIVVNIEVADPAWIASNDDVDGVRIIPYTDEQPAYIGLGWNESDGFEQPAP
jgi:hypothetical protein